MENEREELGGTFLSLIDEDGNEVELEHLDTFEYKGQTYMAFYPPVPSDENGNPMEPDPENEDFGLVLLRVEDGEDGEEELCTLDSEEELEEVFQHYNELLFEEEED